jgi:hypothetical protein
MMFGLAGSCQSAWKSPPMLGSWPLNVAPPSSEICAAVARM